LMHIWKFDNDADRRDHWKRLFESQAFMALPNRAALW
jgi:hypothetical protein